MQKIRCKRSPLVLAVMGVLGVAGTARGEEVKELPVVEVNAAPDTRAVPLDAPAATGSRLGIAIKEMPASVEVISQEAMRQRGDRTVVEATEKAAGFSGGVTGGTPGIFSVRGFTTNGVAWLYNGVSVPGGSGMSTRIIDSANYDRIEVLRGPASVLYGEGAIGAAVNLISRTPSFALQPIEVDYAFSSFDSHRLHVGTGGTIKEGVAAYRADVSSSRSGSYVHDERTALDRFTGSLLFKLSDTIDLTLELDHLRDDTDNFSWGTPLVNGRIDESLRRINYNKLNDDRFQSETTWLRANLDWRIAPDVTLRNQTYYYDSFRDWRNAENYQFNAGAPATVTRSSWGDLDHDHQLFGNRFEALFSGQLAGMKHRMLIGTDVNSTEFKTKRNGFPGTQVVDAYNPPSVDFFSVAGVNKSLAREVAIDQWSLFAESQLALTGTTKLVSGVRHDRFSTDWIYHNLAGAPRESKTHSFNSSRLGVVHDLTPDTALYASYATAVEPGGTLLLLNRNQSQLDLTKARQVEAGVKQSFWAGKGEWTAAVYEIEKRNVFVPDPSNPVNRLPVGKQSSQGIELTIGLRPTERWQIDANLATVHARYDDYSTGNPPVSLSGNTPSFVPRVLANLGVSYKPVPELTLGGWARYVDDVYVDDANSARLPAYTTLDLSADYAWSKTTDIGFRIRNATDELYASWAYRPNQVTIAPPRSYELSLRMRF